MAVLNLSQRHVEYLVKGVMFTMAEIAAGIKGGAIDPADANIMAYTDVLKSDLARFKAMRKDEKKK